jgi:hypothetical protein
LRVLSTEVENDDCLVLVGHSLIKDYTEACERV